MFDGFSVVKEPKLNFRPAQSEAESCEGSQNSLFSPNDGRRGPSPARLRLSASVQEISARLARHPMELFGIPKELIPENINHSFAIRLVRRSKTPCLMLTFSLPRITALIFIILWD